MVSAKKRVKSMIQARPRRNSSLKPTDDSLSIYATESKPSYLDMWFNPTPFGLNDIILTATTVMKQQGAPMVGADPLDALNSNIEDDPNVDKFLNLQNIEDVEMSTDSTKRKQCEEEEKATSHGP